MPPKKKNPELTTFLKDLATLFAVKKNKKVAELVLQEYPFDQELLSLSELYCHSRIGYLELGGRYSAKVCSVPRSLSSHDLFTDNIEYSPLLSEFAWFQAHYQETAEPENAMKAMMSFNGISVFHEQNHRILWRLLPPAPTEQRDLGRYLNFAESLVVTLDLALADQVGKKLSPLFEKFKTTYRTGGQDTWHTKSKKEYRKYLLSMMYASYLNLELINPEDIPKAVNYLFPGQAKLNKDAIKRALDISEVFTQNTNQLWQSRYWKKAQASLELFHQNSIEDALYLPEDPLDFEEEFHIANHVFDQFAL